MNAPGMTPPMSGLGGNNMQGMNDQEQMMVKGVSGNHCAFAFALTSALGKLCSGLWLMLML